MQAWLRYGADEQIAQPLKIIKCYDRHRIDCMANDTDVFMVDKFIRYVEHRIVNDPNMSTYQIYEGSWGDWVAWAAKQDPPVRLPDFPGFFKYASRFEIALERVQKGHVYIRSKH